MDHWREQRVGPPRTLAQWISIWLRSPPGCGALPPSCGPVRLIAVDGHAGSGKSTFAGRLAEALGGAPVVHTDDLATHEELFAWSERLARAGAGAAVPGRDARATASTTGCAGGSAEERALDAGAACVLVEGVGAGRRALRP